MSTHLTAFRNLPQWEVGNTGGRASQLAFVWFPHARKPEAWALVVTQAEEESRMPIITAFEASPDEGQGHARDMRVRWAFEEVGQPYDVKLRSFEALKQPAHLALNPFGPSTNLRAVLSEVEGRRGKQPADQRTSASDTLGSGCAGRPAPLRAPAPGARGSRPLGVAPSQPRRGLARAAWVG